MVLVSLLSALWSAPAEAGPAVRWTATCTDREEPTLWWALTVESAPPQPADFTCPLIFLDGVDCQLSVGFGKLLDSGETHNGKPVWEVRYLPYGDGTTILSFLDRTEQGVTFVPKLKPTKPGVPAMVDPDARSLSRDELFLRYLTQREKSSHATAGVTLHLWTCPEAPFTVPEADLAAQGMSVRTHVGKFVLR